MRRGAFHVLVGERRPETDGTIFIERTGVVMPTGSCTRNCEVFK
jgi:hypothetical protein